LTNAYNIDGNNVLTTSAVDYTNYSFVQKWASKGVPYSQGFDIYGGKVFWVAKSGNDSIPANCYVWNLSDGSQALDSAYITVYSGHGNNLSIDYPKMYATTAYMPSTVYVNTFSDDYVATLTQTLLMSDGSRNCDACVDETNKNMLWTLAHTAGADDTSAPFLISKWDLTQIADNGDGTYTPKLIKSVSTPQPSTSFYFQGLRMHDGLLWYANGNGTGRSYVRAVNPNTGVEVYTIDLETNTEPEGVAWVEDTEAVGGYAMYVGFQGMMLRKYTFGAN
jgi:hypothetical protein